MNHSRTFAKQAEKLGQIARENLREPYDARPSRTKDGQPWVRWAGNGWMAAGGRHPNLGGRQRFWHAIVAAEATLADRKLDTVRVGGEEILSMGALGASLASGSAQALMRECVRAQPMRFLEAMAPAVHATGFFLRETPRAPLGTALCDLEGHMWLTPAEIRRAVLLGAPAEGRWTALQKEAGRRWAACCSALLRDEEMDAAQAAHAAQVMPVKLPRAARQLVGWHGRTDDTWTVSTELQLLWALLLILAQRDPLGAEDLFASAHAPAPGCPYPDAAEMLLGLERVATSAELADLRGRAIAILRPMLGVAP